MTGIAQMFAELDGYDRLDDAIEHWATLVLDAKRRYWRERNRTPGYRAYQRQYRRHRYANDPAWRDQWRAYTKQWRANRRGPVPPRPPAEHGTYYFYTKRKCRCEACRAASATYRRERRAALRSAA